MCRNIKTLFNFDPPASGQDVREAEAVKARVRSATRSGRGRPD
jgi:hypothetical protein